MPNNVVGAFLAFFAVLRQIEQQLLRVLVDTDVVELLPPRSRVVLERRPLWHVVLVLALLVRGWRARWRRRRPILRRRAQREPLAPLRLILGLVVNFFFYLRFFLTNDL